MYTLFIDTYIMNMKKLEAFATHTLYWIICSLTLLNVGFFFGITINSWSLPITYIMYITVYYLLEWWRKKKISIAHVATTMLLIPIIFTVFTWLFGHTFDASYDGQSYHQSAVLSLVNGWNPWYEYTLPIPVIEAEQYIIGYPKALWTLQSEIYSFYPQHINSATVTNLLISLIAAIFVYSTLIRLTVSKAWATLITLLAVLQTTILQQFFTFMADGFSYQLCLIAISSLITILLEKEKQMPLSIFLAAVILLIATKSSNALIFLFLVLVCGIYIYKFIRMQKKLLHTLFIFLFAGILILWVPYGRNIIVYGSPIYPSNQAWAQEDVRIQNTPSNLKDANNFILLFYGIYAKPQIASSPDSNDNVAILKIPFSTSLEELYITNNFQGRVGSEGALFSGLFTLSILMYSMLLLINKNTVDRRNFLCVSILSGLTIVAALLHPSPNQLRFNPIMTLIPLYILVSLVLLSKNTQYSWTKPFMFVFTILIIANILMKLVPTIEARIDETKAVTEEMKQMRESGKIYQVQSQSFYSTFIRLEENGVRFIKKEALECDDPIVLQLSNYRTFYCS